MGRTLPTQIQLLHRAEEEWKGFRRALRKEDQASFDALWLYARRHAMAAAQAERPLPIEAHFLAMLVGIKRELESLRHDGAQRLDP